MVHKECCPECASTHAREVDHPGTTDSLPPVAPTLTLEPVTNVYIVKRTSRKKEIPPADGQNLLSNFRDYSKFVLQF